MRPIVAPPPPVRFAPAGDPRGPLPGADEQPPLYRLRVSDLWAFLCQQPISYWLISIYLFLEYVRPQHIFEPLQALPLSLMTIALCGVALLLERRPNHRIWTVADTLILLLSIVVLLSSLTAYSPAEAFKYIDIYYSWVVVYFLITTVVSSERRLLVFLLGYLIYCTKMSQHGVRSWAMTGFGFNSWGVTCAPGWFQNSGECGIQMVMFLPVSLFFALALKPYWGTTKFLIFAAMPATAAATVIASSSRGAIVGLAAIGLWLLARSPKKAKAVLFLAVAAGLVYAAIPDEQKQRFSSMGEDRTSISRITYWNAARDIMNQHPVLGVGYYNWSVYYTERYDPKGEMTHNTFLQAGAELGYSGLGAFLLLILATFYLNWKTRRMAERLERRGEFLRSIAYGLDGALVGFLAAGFFISALYYPFFWINLSLTVALHCSAAHEAGGAPPSTPRRASPFRPGVVGRASSPVLR